MSINKIPANFQEIETGKKRAKIRGSRFYEETLANFEEEAKTELTAMALNVLDQVSQLTTGLTPPEYDLEAILEVIGTNAFRDFSLALEDADLDTYKNMYLDELANILESDRDLYASVILEKLEVIGHRWTIYIHGSVQSRLSAAALMMREASSRNNFEVIEEAIGLLKVILEDPASHFASSVRSLAEEIEARMDPWEGLLNIQLELDSMIATSHSSRNADIGEIIGEIISNAVRHGDARNLSVEIAPIEGNELVIRVEDDSITAPEVGIVHAGLGTKIFNSASDGRWLLERDEASLKTIFEIVVSMDGEGR
jgi:two-component sensor histidine kinase